ncbi:mechanosensitive ion channel family protein [Amphibiibacter pelophylacis]|uniref:Mechanosensitive ion channel n=1 Tax=Amphibiibacter pelophylacis TaxID=1799477 RepID=A0ACC6NYN4_9BURK
MNTLFDPKTLIGALSLGAVFLVAALVLAALVRRLTRRVAPHLTDVTGLAFASALGQVMVYLGTFVLYAHLVPDLRALGTALLTGVSIVSVVIGLAAQNTLGNLVAGLSLVLYRPVRVGDWVQVSAPAGVTTACVELLSLGYTTLRDAQGRQVLVPNSVMVSSVVVRLSAEQAAQASQPPAPSVAG